MYKDLGDYLRKKTGLDSVDIQGYQETAQGGNWIKVEFYYKDSNSTYIDHN
jgi:hypothetical protein